jgi:tetratricopeptide (TPR) repeat protein/predicted Ser/Thr protein kinase
VIGSFVSRYQILSRIGEGGMGEVFLGHDPSLNRRVALKFLPAAQTATPDARTRLLHEAQAAARLDHPFVCKVYEAGESDGRPYIAMEYVEGQTVQELLRHGPLPVKEAIRLATEIAEALDFAHKRGIVHRDLKPSNVMVGADGHVKVMDFGVAKYVEARAADAAITMTATAAGETSGTTIYMSPEQLRGLPVDGRSDAFAFGLLLYEMTSGAHAFPRSSVFSTVDAILNDTPAPLERQRPGVPPMLAHIISRCLEKDKDQRYQSLREAQIELSRLADGTGSGGTRTREAHRPGRRWLVAAAVVAVAATAGAVMWTWPERFALSRTALAFNERDWILISDFENLTGDAVFDRSLRVALEVGIAQSQYVNVLPPQRVQAALQRMQRKPGDGLDEVLASEVAVREGVRAVLSCSIAQIGGVYALTARVIDPQSRAALVTESVQADSKAQILGALDELATAVRRRLGESLAGVSQKSVPLPKATTSSLDALKLYSDAVKADTSVDAGAASELLRQAILLDPQFALAHAQLGHRYYLMGERATRERGEDHFVKALALLDRLTPRERLWIQASADDSRGNRPVAVQGYRAYLAQYPDDAGAWFRLGWTLMAGLRQFEPAIEAFERAVALRPTDANSLVNIATCYSGLDRYPEAIAAYRKAFASDPSLLTGIFVNHEYGFTLVDNGDLDGAAAAFATMRAHRDLGKQARGFRSQAFLDMYRGRYELAISGLRQAILINAKLGSTISEFRDRLILARALDAKGRAREASVELAAIDRLIAKLSLAPQWLRLPVNIHARRRDVGRVRGLVDSMAKTNGAATADAASNRNVTDDENTIAYGRGELALAEGRAADAASILEGARVGAFDPQIVEALAAAQLAAGDLNAAAKSYEEVIAKPALGREPQEEWLRAHVTLGAVYERLGRPEAAREVRARLLALWQDGDDDLLALREVRARLPR